MSLVRRRNMNEVPGRVGWWTLLLVVLVYVAFSLQMGVAELLFLFGVGADVKHRATPVVTCQIFARNAGHAALPGRFGHVRLCWPISNRCPS